MDEKMRAVYMRGARKGHREGKHRAWMYVLGEAEYRAQETDCPKKLTPNEARCWCRGFIWGYKRAAEGSELALQKTG